MTPTAAMYERSQVLASKLASVTGERKKKRARTLKTDRTLQQLVGDLVAARRAAAMTQEEVAASMWTTKSVVSRLESGVCTRPTLTRLRQLARRFPQFEGILPDPLAASF